MKKIEIGGLELLLLLAVFFAAGIILGFKFDSCEKSKEVDYDKIVEYLEQELVDFPGIYGSSAITEYSTIGNVKDFYFKLKPVSSSVLTSKVKSICTKVDWETVPEEPIDDAAEDICLQFCEGYFNDTR